MVGRSQDGDKVEATGKRRPTSPAAAKRRAPVEGAIAAAATSEMQSLQSGLPMVAQGRHSMIAEAAYYRAERRGFGPGDCVRDWLEAEAEIAQRLDTIAEA